MKIVTSHRFARRRPLHLPFSLRSIRVFLARIQTSPVLPTVLMFQLPQSPALADLSALHPLRPSLGGGFCMRLAGIVPQQQE